MLGSGYANQGMGGRLVGEDKEEERFAGKEDVDLSTVLGQLFSWPFCRVGVRKWRTGADINV